LKFKSGTKLTSLLVVASIALAFPTSANEADENAAVAASKQWLSIVDKGQYGQCWDQSSSFFKANVKKKDLEAKLKASRGQFGDLVSRKLKTKQFTTTMPGAPDGKYVVIQYDTSFSHKQSAVETITPMFDKGAWKVSGYYVK
jgi:Protein of unknown function (DUF4019)